MSPIEITIYICYNTQVYFCLCLSFTSDRIRPHAPFVCGFDKIIINEHEFETKMFVDIVHRSLICS